MPEAQASGVLRAASAPNGLRRGLPIGFDPPELVFLYISPKLCYNNRQSKRKGEVHYAEKQHVRKKQQGTGGRPDPVILRKIRRNDMNKIRLEKIDENNFLQAFALKLGPGQDSFVSHPMRSLA